MKKVTAVVPLDKRRSKVFVDEEAAFVLYKGELRRYRIEEGEELSEEQHGRILEEVLMKRGKERALYLLKDRDRTEAEIRKKLKEGFYPQQVIDRTMDFLKEYGFVDDLEFGRRYIEVYGNQRSQIQAFLRKKGYVPENTSPRERAKLIAALARKGFSYEAVYQNLGGSREEG